MEYWDARQIKDFALEIKASIGGASAWDMVVPRLRKALVSEKVLSLVMIQMIPPTKEVITELHSALLKELGLG